jgi:hypothetical protein
MGDKMWSEKDLRRMMAKDFGDQIFWVEHARGGTPGFPDCVIADSGRAVFSELKAGDVRVVGNPDNDEVAAFWTPELRPAQIAVMKRLVGNGVESNVTIVDRKTGRVFIAGSKEILASIWAQRQAVVAEVFELGDGGGGSKVQKTAKTAEKLSG